MLQMSASPEDQAIVDATIRSLPELEAELRRRDQYKIKRYFQDTGPYRRELYAKMCTWFAAGAQHRERALVAANRVGKTDGASFEVTLHLTGEYPDWWVGKRFARPVRAWAAGTTSEKTKEIIQVKLIGPETARGTGMIPARTIHHIAAKTSGASGSIGTVWVKHASGGLSILQLKSFDQGRTAFEGTEQEVIWLDEEPDEPIYTECLLRTMSTGDTFMGGIILLTFTPLQGMSEVVKLFLPSGTFPAGGVVPDAIQEIRE